MVGGYLYKGTLTIMLHMYEIHSLYTMDMYLGHNVTASVEYSHFNGCLLWPFLWPLCKDQCTVFDFCMPTIFSVVHWVFLAGIVCWLF